MTALLEEAKEGFANLARGPEGRRHLGSCDEGLPSIEPSLPGRRPPVASPPQQTAG